MSVITKTGDQGQTSLFDGSRVPKSHPRIEALGALDELNAHLAGLKREEIQEDIFQLSALVANPKTPSDELVLDMELQILEKRTLNMEDKLPPLTNFILPGGTPEAIRAHQARAICRRAERYVSQIEGLPKNILPYLNRLSDFLFILARHFNHKAGVEEIVWTSKKVL